MHSALAAITSALRQLHQQQPDSIILALSYNKNNVLNIINNTLHTGIFNIILTQYLK